jgi:hypothetical protein|tara:strand:+ start:2085 stop:2294 length:210 start_codon:yes stop_codon:yes gene_type:complete
LNSDETVSSLSWRSFCQAKRLETKEEWPKTFWLSIFLPYVLAALAVWGILDPSGLWGFVKSIIGFMGFL